MQNLCSHPNALFRGTKVVKRQFYSIRTKMMIGSVSEHFSNLRHVKRCKTCVRTRMHYFGVPNLRRIHSTPLEPKWCLGVFQSISLTVGTWKYATLVFRAWMHYFWVPKLRSIHSTPLEQNDVWECLEHFTKLRHVKRCKTCVRAQIHRFGVPKLWRIHSTGSVSEYFANLRHVKRF
jgi:hypothetical protein